MAKYNEFFYGGSTNTEPWAYYGPSSGFSYITPRGPSTGGAYYLIEGDGFDIQSSNDYFVDPVLDPVRWFSRDSGSGAYSVGNPGLLLNTGSTPNSVSGISTDPSFTSVQFEIRPYLVPLTVFPTSNVTLLNFGAYESDLNYAAISIRFDSVTRSVILRCEVVLDSVVVDYKELDWSYGYSTLKIARFGSRVFFSANGERIFSSRKFLPSIDVLFRVFASNGTTSCPVRTLVDYFIDRTFVMFGIHQPDLSPTVVNNSRLRGITPPSMDFKDQEVSFKGSVDVYVVNSFSTVYTSDAYEYFYVDKFKAFNSNRERVTLSLVDDDQVVTLT
jgi:hypothetical protein